MSRASSYGIAQLNHNDGQYLRSAMSERSEKELPATGDSNYNAVASNSEGGSDVDLGVPAPAHTRGDIGFTAEQPFPVPSIPSYAVQDSPRQATGTAASSSPLDLNFSANVSDDVMANQAISSPAFLPNAAGHVTTGISPTHKREQLASEGVHVNTMHPDARTGQAYHQFAATSTGLSNVLMSSCLDTVAQDLSSTGLGQVPVTVTLASFNETSQGHLQAPVGLPERPAGYWRGNAMAGVPGQWRGCQEQMTRTAGQPAPLHACGGSAVRQRQAAPQRQQPQASQCALGRDDFSLGVPLAFGRSQGGAFPSQVSEMTGWSQGQSFVTSRHPNAGQCMALPPGRPHPISRQSSRCRQLSWNGGSAPQPGSPPREKVYPRRQWSGPSPSNFSNQANAGQNYHHRQGLQSTPYRQHCLQPLQQLPHLQQPSQQVQPQHQLLPMQQRQHPQQQPPQELREYEQLRMQHQRRAPQRQHQHEEHQQQEVSQQQQYENVQPQQVLQAENEQILQKLLQLQSQLQQHERARQKRNQQKQPVQFQPTGNFEIGSLNSCHRPSHPKTGKQRQVLGSPPHPDVDFSFPPSSESSLSGPSSSTSPSMSCRSGERFYLARKPPLHRHRLMNTSTQPSTIRLLSMAAKSSIMRVKCTQTNTENLARTSMACGRNEPSSLRDNAHCKARTRQVCVSSSSWQSGQSPRSCHGDGSSHVDKPRRRSLTLPKSLGQQGVSQVPQTRVCPPGHSDEHQQGRQLKISGKDSAIQTRQPDRSSPPVFIHPKSEIEVTQGEALTIIISTEPQSSPSQPATLRACVGFSPRQHPKERTSQGDEVCSVSLSPSSCAVDGGRVTYGVSDPLPVRKQLPVSRRRGAKEMWVFRGHTVRKSPRMRYRHLPEASSASVGTSSGSVEFQSESKYQDARNEARFAPSGRRECSVKFFNSFQETEFDFASVSELQSGSDDFLSTTGSEHELEELNGAFASLESLGMTKYTVPGDERLHPKKCGQKDEAGNENSKDRFKPSSKRKRDKPHPLLIPRDQRNSYERPKRPSRNKPTLSSSQDSFDRDISSKYTPGLSRGPDSSRRSHINRRSTRSYFLQQERKRVGVPSFKPSRLHESRSSEVSGAELSSNGRVSPCPSSSYEAREAASWPFSETPRTTSRANPSRRSPLERREQSQRFHNRARGAGVLTTCHEVKHMQTPRKLNPTILEDSTTTNLPRLETQARKTCAHFRNERQKSHTHDFSERRLSSKPKSCEKAIECCVIPQTLASTQTKAVDSETSDLTNAYLHSTGETLGTSAGVRALMKTCGSQCSLSDRDHRVPSAPAGCGEKQREAGPVAGGEVWSTAGAERLEASTSSPRLSAEAATSTYVVLPRDLARWLQDRHVTEDTMRRLVEEGFDSVPVLAHLEPEDLRDMQLPMGQQRLLLHLVARLRSGEDALDPPPGTSVTGAGEDRNRTPKAEENLGGDRDSKAAGELQPFTSEETDDDQPARGSPFPADRSDRREAPLSTQTKSPQSSTQSSQENPPRRPQRDGRLTGTAQIPEISIYLAATSLSATQQFLVDSTLPELGVSARTPLNREEGERYCASCQKVNSGGAKSAEQPPHPSGKRAPENDYPSLRLQNSLKEPVRKARRIRKVSTTNPTPNVCLGDTDEAGRHVRVFYLGSHRVESTSKLIVSPQKRRLSMIKDERTAYVCSDEFHSHETLPHDQPTRLNLEDSVGVHGPWKSLVKSGNINASFPTNKPVPLLKGDQKSTLTYFDYVYVPWETEPCINGSRKNFEDSLNGKQHFKSPLRSKKKGTAAPKKGLSSRFKQKDTPGDADYFGRSNSSEASLQLGGSSSNSVSLNVFKKFHVTSKGKYAPVPLKRLPKLNDDSESESVHNTDSLDTRKFSFHTDHSEEFSDASTEVSQLVKSPAKSNIKGKPSPKNLLPKPDDEYRARVNYSNELPSQETILNKFQIVKYQYNSNRCSQLMNSPLKPEDKISPSPKKRRLSIFTNDDLQRDGDEYSEYSNPQESFPHLDLIRRSSDIAKKVNYVGTSAVNSRLKYIPSPKKRLISTLKDNGLLGDDKYCDASGSQDGFLRENHTRTHSDKPLRRRHQFSSSPKDAVSLRVPTSPELSRLHSQRDQQSFRRRLAHGTVGRLWSRPATAPRSPLPSSARKRRRGSFMDPTESWLLRYRSPGRSPSPGGQRSPCGGKSSARWHVSRGGEEDVLSAACLKSRIGPVSRMSLSARKLYSKDGLSPDNEVRDGAQSCSSRGKSQTTTSMHCRRSLYDNKCQSSLQGSKHLSTCKMDIMDMVTSPDNVDLKSVSDSSCHSEDTVADKTKNNFLSPPRMSQKRLARLYGRNLGNAVQTAPHARCSRRKGAKTCEVVRAHVFNRSFRKDTAAFSSRLKNPIQRRNTIPVSKPAMLPWHRSSFPASPPTSKRMVDQGKLSVDTGDSKISRLTKAAQRSQNSKSSGGFDSIDLQQSARKRTQPNSAFKVKLQGERTQGRSRPRILELEDQELTPGSRQVGRWSKSANSGSKICVSCSRSVSVCCCCENIESEWRYTCPFGRPVSTQQAPPLRGDPSFEVAADAVSMKVSSPAPGCSKATSSRCGRKLETQVTSWCHDVSGPMMQCERATSPCCIQKSSPQHWPDAAKANTSVFADMYQAKCSRPETPPCPVTFHLRAESPCRAFVQKPETSKAEKRAKPVKEDREVLCPTYVFSASSYLRSTDQLEVSCFRCVGTCKSGTGWQEQQTQTREDAEDECSLHTAISSSRSHRSVKAGCQKGSSKFCPEGGSQSPANAVSPLETRSKYSCRCSRGRDETVATFVRKLGQADKFLSKTPSALTVHKSKASPGRASWHRTPGEYTTFASVVTRLMLAKKTMAKFRSAKNKAPTAKDESENNETSFQHAVQQTEPALVLTLPRNDDVRTSTFTGTSFLSEMRGGPSPRATVYISPPHVHPASLLYRTKELVMGDEVGSNSKKKYFLEVPRVTESSKAVTRVSQARQHSPPHAVRTDWATHRKKSPFEDEITRETSNPRCGQRGHGISIAAQHSSRSRKDCARQNAPDVSPHKAKPRERHSSSNRIRWKKTKSGRSTDEALERHVTHSSQGHLVKSSSSSGTGLTARASTSAGKRRGKRKQESRVTDRPRGSKGRRGRRSASHRPVHSRRGKRSHRRRRGRHVSPSSERLTISDCSSCEKPSKGRRLRRKSRRKMSAASDSSVVCKKRTDPYSSTDNDRSHHTRRSRRRFQSHKKHTDSSSSDSTCHEEHRRRSRSFMVRGDDSKGRASSSSGSQQGKRPQRANGKARGWQSDDSSSREVEPAGRNCSPKGERHCGATGDAETVTTRHKNAKDKRKYNRRSLPADSDSFAEEECTDIFHGDDANQDGSNGRYGSLQSRRIKNKSNTPEEKGNRREDADHRSTGVKQYTDKSDIRKMGKYALAQSEGTLSSARCSQNDKREVEYTSSRSAQVRDRPCRPTQRGQDGNLADRSAHASRFRETLHSSKSQQANSSLDEPISPTATPSFTETHNIPKAKKGLLKSEYKTPTESVKTEPNCYGDRKYKTEAGDVSTFTDHGKSNAYVKAAVDSSRAERFASPAFCPLDTSGWMSTGDSGQEKKFPKISDNPKEKRDELAARNSMKAGVHYPNLPVDHEKNPSLKNARCSPGTRSRSNTRKMKTQGASDRGQRSTSKQDSPENKPGGMKPRHSSGNTIKSGDALNICKGKIDGRRNKKNKSCTCRSVKPKNASKACKSKPELSVVSPSGSPLSTLCTASVFSGYTASDLDNGKHATGLHRQRPSLHYNTSVSEDDEHETRQIRKKPRKDLNATAAEEVEHKTALIRKSAKRDYNASASEAEENKNVLTKGDFGKDEDKIKQRKSGFPDKSRKTLDRRNPLPIQSTAGPHSGDRSKNKEKTREKAKTSILKTSVGGVQTGLSSDVAVPVETKEGNRLGGKRNNLQHVAVRKEERMSQNNDSTGDHANGVHGENKEEEDPGEGDDVACKDNKKESKKVGVITHVEDCPCSPKSPLNGGVRQGVSLCDESRSDFRYHSRQSDAGKTRPLPTETCSSSPCPVCCVERGFPQTLPWSCSSPPRLISLCREHAWMDVATGTRNSRNQGRLPPARDRSSPCSLCAAWSNIPVKTVRPTYVCPFHQSPDGVCFQEHCRGVCQQHRSSVEYAGKSVSANVNPERRADEVEKEEEEEEEEEEQSCIKSGDAAVFADPKSAGECASCHWCPHCQIKSAPRSPSTRLSLPQRVSPARRGVQRPRPPEPSEPDSDPHTNRKTAGICDQERTAHQTSPRQRKRFPSPVCPAYFPVSRRCRVPSSVLTHHMRLDTGGCTQTCSGSVLSPSTLHCGHRRYPCAPGNSSSTNDSSSEETEDEECRLVCTGYGSGGKCRMKRNILPRDSFSPEDICERCISRVSRCSSPMEERLPSLSHRRQRQPSLLSIDQTRQMSHRDREQIAACSCRGRQAEPCPVYLQEDSSQTQPGARRVNYEPRDEGTQAGPRCGRSSFSGRDVSGPKAPGGGRAAEKTDFSSDSGARPLKRSPSSQSKKPVSKKQQSRKLKKRHGLPSASSSDESGIDHRTEDPSAKRGSPSTQREGPVLPKPHRDQEQYSRGQPYAIDAGCTSQVWPDQRRVDGWMKRPSITGYPLCEQSPFIQREGSLHPMTKKDQWQYCGGQPYFINDDDNSLESREQRHMYGMWEHPSRSRSFGEGHPLCQGGCSARERPHRVGLRSNLRRPFVSRGDVSDEERPDRRRMADWAEEQSVKEVCLGKQSPSSLIDKSFKAGFISQHSPVSDKDPSVSINAERNQLEDSRTQNLIRHTAFKSGVIRTCASTSDGDESPLTYLEGSSGKRTCTSDSFKAGFVLQHCPASCKYSILRQSHAKCVSFKEDLPIKCSPVLCDNDTVQSDSEDPQSQRHFCPGSGEATDGRKTSPAAFADQSLQNDAPIQPGRKSDDATCGLKGASVSGVNDSPRAVTDSVSPERHFKTRSKSSARTSASGPSDSDKSQQRHHSGDATTFSERRSSLEGERPVGLSIVDKGDRTLDKVPQRTLHGREGSHLSQAGPLHVNVKAAHLSNRRSSRPQAHVAQHRRGSYEDRMRSFRSSFLADHNESSNVQDCPTLKYLSVPTPSGAGCRKSLLMETPDNLGSSTKEEELPDFDQELFADRVHSYRVFSSSEDSGTHECASPAEELGQCGESQKSNHEAEYSCRGSPSLFLCVQKTPAYLQSTRSSSSKILRSPRKKPQHFVVSRNVKEKPISNRLKSRLVRKESLLSTTTNARLLRSRSLFLRVRRNRLKIDNQLKRLSPEMTASYAVSLESSFSTVKPVSQPSLKKSIPGLSQMRSSNIIHSLKSKLTKPSVADLSPNLLNGRSSSTSLVPPNNTPEFHTSATTTEEGRGTVIITSERVPDLLTPPSALPQSEMTPCEEAAWSPEPSPWGPVTPLPSLQPPRSSSGTAGRWGKVALPVGRAGKGTLKFANTGGLIKGLTFHNSKTNVAPDASMSQCSPSCFMLVQGVGATHATRVGQDRLDTSRKCSPLKRSAHSPVKEGLKHSSASCWEVHVPASAAFKTCSSAKSKTFSRLPSIKSKTAHRRRRCPASPSTGNQVKGKRPEVHLSLPRVSEASASRHLTTRTASTFPTLATHLRIKSKRHSLRVNTKENSEARRSWKIDDSELSQTDSPLSLLQKKSEGRGGTSASCQEERRGRREVAVDQCGHSCLGEVRNCDFCSIYNGNMARAERTAFSGSLP